MVPRLRSHWVADLYLQGDFASTTVEAHSSPGFADPTAFAGTYLDPRTKTIYRFTAERGNLIGWGEPLRRIDADRFYDLGSGVITFDNENGRMRASLRIPGELYFSGDRIQTLQPSVVQLGSFTGNFHSEELNTTYMLSVEEGRLTVTKRNNAMVPLDAATQDEFYSSDLGTIVFHTDANHHVSGFNLFTQQARGIVFTKVN